MVVSLRVSFAPVAAKQCDKVWLYAETWFDGVFGCFVVQASYDISLHYAFALLKGRYVWLCTNNPGSYFPKGILHGRSCSLIGPLSNRKVPRTVCSWAPLASMTKFVAEYSTGSQVQFRIGARSLDGCTRVRLWFGWWWCLIRWYCNRYSIISTVTVLDEAERMQYGPRNWGRDFKYELSPIGQKLLQPTVSGQHTPPFQAWSCLCGKLVSHDDLCVRVAQRLSICWFSPASVWFAEGPLLWV